MSLAFLTYFLSAIVLYWGWKFGGRPERLATTSILIWIAVDPVYRALIHSPQFGSVDWGLVVFDCGLAGAMVAIALNANRVWSVFAAAFSLIPLLGHMAVILENHSASQAYWAINQLPFLFVLLSLMFGTTAVRRRINIGIAWPDWSY